MEVECFVSLPSQPHAFLADPVATGHVQTLLREPHSVLTEVLADYLCRSLAALPNEGKWMVLQFLPAIIRSYITADSAPSPHSVGIMV